MHPKKARLVCIISIAVAMIGALLSILTENNIFGGFGGFTGIGGMLFFAYSGRCPKCQSVVLIANRGGIVIEYKTCGTRF